MSDRTARMPRYMEHHKDGPPLGGDDYMVKRRVECRKAEARWAKAFADAFGYDDAQPCGELVPRRPSRRHARGYKRPDVAKRHKAHRMKLWRLFVAGKTSAECAQAMACSKSTIYKRASEMGFTFFGTGKAHRKKANG